MLTWIVGSGGLLGGALARRVPRRFDCARIPWNDSSATTELLDFELARFASEVGDDEWALVWAAGSGVVASSTTELEAETALLAGFLTSLRARRPDGHGAFFLASSAGGLYAGAADPPHDERTPPRPVSAYGEAKLRQEGLAREVLSRALPLVIGRFSNLYGPGQNLVKAQGLVSHLCLAAAQRRALNLFVPMETLRDYLYVDDAARMVEALVATAIRDQPEEPVIRNLVSGHATPVGGVVRIVQQVARRPVQIGLGRSVAARDQVRDLRVTSCFSADDVARVPVTPLPVGVKRVYEHALEALRDRPLARA